MVIAPGEAGSDGRSEPTRDIGPLDSARGWSLRSWRNGHSADTADKARTALCPFLHERKHQGRVSA